MRLAVILSLALLIASPALAQTVPATSTQSDAFQQEVERVRTFKQSLGVDLTPVAPNGIEEIQLYEPSEETEAVRSEAEVATRTHAVAKGDTLYALSKRYGVSVTQLRKVNKLEGNHLALGQTLTIPAIEQTAEIGRVRRIVEPVPVEDETQSVSEPLQPSLEIYAVLPKDTLAAISRRSCVPMAELIELNTLRRPDQLIPGQRLRLPDDHCLPN